MLILKVHGKGGTIVLEDNGNIDVGAIGLETGSSVTLIGSVTLRQWLVVGRS
jgi:hypothetical protein